MENDKTPKAPAPQTDAATFGEDGGCGCATEPALFTPRRTQVPVDADRFLAPTELPAPLPLDEAMAKVKNWFRAKSLNVLAFGTACGAIELAPLATSRFDMERFGITMAPTSRQANVFIISGYLSVKTLKRAIRAWEQMPSPKWIVCLGSCTIDGGMYWDSYYTVKDVAKYLPVDVYIHGCMPRPEALIEGFQFLMQKIERGEANGWQEYTENLAWYKDNQKSVIKTWDMPDYNW